MLDIVAGGHKQVMLVYLDMYIILVWYMFMFVSIHVEQSICTLVSLTYKVHHDLSVGFQEMFVPEVHVPKLACCVCFSAFLFETWSQAARISYCFMGFQVRDVLSFGYFKSARIGRFMMFMLLLFCPCFQPTVWFGLLWTEQLIHSKFQFVQCIATWHLFHENPNGWWNVLFIK